MTIKLNHTIVYSRDKQASSAFLAEIFGLPPPVAFGPFLGVEAGNEVTLDFFDDEGGGTPQHYAFLVNEDEFDQTFGRIQGTRGGLLGRPGTRPGGRDQYPRRRARSVLR